MIYMTKDRLCNKIYVIFETGVFFPDTKHLVNYLHRIAKESCTCLLGDKATIYGICDSYRFDQNMCMYAADKIAVDTFSSIPQPRKKYEKRYSSKFRLKEAQNSPKTL